MSQSQKSVDSFAFQWTERTVQDSEGTFYRRLFHDMKIWHDHLNGKTVAYVGSGNGRHVWALCQLSSAVKIISVELAERSIEHQRRTLTDSRIEFIQGDAAEVSFTADFLYLTGVIQHTANPIQTLGRCIDNLTDGGEMVVSFYMRTPATMALEPIRTMTRRLPKRILWAISPLLAPIFMVRPAGRESGFGNAVHTAYDWFGSHHFQYYFTDEQIRSMLQQCGIHPRNVLWLSKGLYKIRKGGAPDLSTIPVSFGA